MHYCFLNCPGSSGSCLLVGDNERKDSLFWFRLDGKPFEDAKQQQLQFKGGKIDDIEALARLRNGRIIAFGSYSRTTKCEDRPDRRRFGVIDQPAKESAALWVSKPTPIDCDALFGKNRPRRSAIEAACSAIEAAGRAADNAANDETKCNQAHAYNAEGAVNVSRTEVPDIWIGLRAPLLPNHPNDDERRNLAMLLHLKSLDQYAFDRVTLLDLGGRGVRDLAYTDDGVVWVIAGPPQDLGKKKAEENGCEHVFCVQVRRWLSAHHLQHVFKRRQAGLHLAVCNLSGLGCRRTLLSPGSYASAAPAV